MRLFESEYQVPVPASPELPVAEIDATALALSSPRTPTNYSPESPVVNPRKRLVLLRVPDAVINRVSDCRNVRF